MQRKILQIRENYETSKENILKPGSLTSYEQKSGWIVETSAGGE